MSDAGRHLAERAKLLRPDQRILGCAEIVKRLLKFLMLICFVEADGGQFCQAVNQRPLPLIERMRFGVQDDEGAKEPSLADQRQSTRFVAAYPARFHDRVSKFRYRADGVEVESGNIPWSAASIR